MGQRVENRTDMIPRGVWSWRTISDEADHRVRNVRLLEGGDLLGCQLDVHGCESIIEMVQFGGPDNRCGNDRLSEQPCQRHLRARNAPRGSNLGYAVDDPSVCFR